MNFIHVADAVFNHAICQIWSYFQRPFLVMLWPCFKWTVFPIPPTENNIFCDYVIYIFPVQTDSTATQLSKKPLFHFSNADKASEERSFNFPDSSEKERLKALSLHYTFKLRQTKE